MSSIQQELEAGRAYAQRGSELADESFQKMSAALEEEEENLREADRQQQYNRRLENDPHFSDQLSELEYIRDQALSEASDNIDELKSRGDDFTIVLYGRTMAGKSTLMEILTNGEGKSIGNGTQRTTRDVRAYEWNGLKIYDLPGICAFEGKADEDKAREAARKADLTIFLISDDGVQQAEAHCLAELKKNGKPVLGIVNVKYGLSARNNVKRKIDLKQVEKKLGDNSKINDIINQFKAFAPEGDFDDIPFVYAHLQAAFFSQAKRENDPSLYELSRFGAVEEFILDKVRRDGKFLRLKSYIDAVARPMQYSIAALYEQSRDTCVACKSYDENIGKVFEWREGFLQYGRSQMDDFLANIRSQFNSKIDWFVDNYYDDSNAESVWKRTMNQLDIGGQCQRFVIDMSNEAKRNMRRFSDDLTQDMSFGAIQVEVPTITMADLTDYGEGLRIGIGAAMLLGPVGWAAGLAGMAFSFLFDSRSEKIREQKRKIRNDLNDVRDKTLSKIDEQLVDAFNDKILHEQVNVFTDNLFAMLDSLKRLAYTQNKIADTINDQYGGLNFEMVSSALKYVNNPYGISGIMTARLVGNELIIFSTNEIPEESRQKMSELLGEKVRTFTVDEDNYWRDVKEIVTDEVLDDGYLEINGVVEEDYGSMVVIDLMPDKEYTDEAELIQQIFDAPAMF